MFKLMVLVDGTNAVIPAVRVSSHKMSRVEFGNILVTDSQSGRNKASAGIDRTYHCDPHIIASSHGGIDEDSRRLADQKAQSSRRRGEELRRT